MIKTQIINLFGGPGTGKSSIAAGLVHALKKQHISCDAPYEFPKILAWDNNKEAIKDQLYVLANQHRGIVKSYGKVKYILVDSPIMLSIVYKDYYSAGAAEYPSFLYGALFDEFIVSLHNFYDSINIVLQRSEETDHNEQERYHNLTESIELDKTIRATLTKWGISYTEISMDKDPVQEIIKLLGKNF